MEIEQIAGTDLMTSAAQLYRSIDHYDNHSLKTSYHILKPQYIKTIFFNHRRIAFVFLALFFIACDRLSDNVYIPQETLFQFNEGDKLLYVSNENNRDTLIVDRISFAFWQPVAYGANYEEQNVWLHFLNKDLRIRFMLTAEYPNYGYSLKWKTHPEFYLQWTPVEDDILINESSYSNVFILPRNEDFVDSLVQFQTIYFNCHYGILKYENENEEAFKFSKKL